MPRVRALSQRLVAMVSGLLLAASPVGNMSAAGADAGSAQLAAPPAFEPWEGPGAEAVNQRLASLARDCRTEMDLPFTHDPGDLIATVDFNRDGRMDVVLDQARVSCDGSQALWSGTGGSPVRIFVSNAAGGWDEHTTGGFAGRVELINDIPVWLSLVHGSACDGYGALPCAQVLIWGDGAFRSVADGKPEPEE